MSSTAHSAATDQEKQIQRSEEVDVLPATERSSAALTFPEGGLSGWLTVLGSLSDYFFSATLKIIVLHLSFGVLEDHYTRIFLNHSSASNVSWIGSMQLFLEPCSSFPSIGLPAGKWFDDGHFRLLMISGTGIYLFSFFMLSICEPNQYYQVFLSQGLFVPAVSLPSHYFRAKRSLVMGMVFAGSSMGGVVFPIILNHLINGPVGFAWGIRTVAFITAILLLIGNLLTRPRLPTKKQRAPEDNAVLKLIMKDFPYWLSVWGACLVIWGIFFPVCRALHFYLQLYAVLHGVDKGVAFYTITVLNAATIFGRTLPNFIADKYGALNVAIPMTTVSGSLVFAMLNLKTVGSLFAFAAFYGFMSLLAAIMSSFAFSVNEIGLVIFKPPRTFCNSPISVRSRIGIAMFLLSLPLLTGAPITGAFLHPPEYTWWRGVVFSGASGFLSNSIPDSA
ncbi:MFS general substrate transporter [Mycena galericulata]|nr:MFS general substrate transporter [Mycena galericulata]